MLLELIEEGRANPGSFEHDSCLSGRFDIKLMGHGAYLGRGRVTRPLEHMSLSSSGPDRIWRQVPGAHSYLIADPYQEALARREGRAAIRAALIQKLERSRKVEARNLLRTLLEKWTLEHSLDWVRESLRSDRGHPASQRPSAQLTWEHLGLELEDVGSSYDGRSGKLGVASRIAEAIAQGDFAMTFLDTKRKQRVGQRAFHRWVVGSFDGFCSCCELRGPGLVEAAHVLPVRDAPERGMDPSNGLALCPNHHRAFDKHLMWIDGGRIRFHKDGELRLSGLRAPARGRLRSTAGRLVDPTALEAHARAAMGRS
ncbi:MAG: HNH endonuclease signature motif containing protein [Planctomycetota bacterium]|nr:HNH endonuclease signature motif containing protein [Planctomycetota bacterium]